MPERLRELLLRFYPGATVDVTPLSGGRVSALLTSSIFDGVDYAVRQHDVWEHLRAVLGPESTQVSTVYVMTPEEAHDATSLLDT